MGVEPACDAGKKTAQTKGQEFITGGVDSGGPHRQLILPDGMKNDPCVGIGYLPHDGAQNKHRDDVYVVIADE